MDHACAIVISALQQAAGSVMAIADLPQEAKTAVKRKLTSILCLVDDVNTGTRRKLWIERRLGTSVCIYAIM